MTKQNKELMKGAIMCADGLALLLAPWVVAVPLMVINVIYTLSTIK